MRVAIICLSAGTSNAKVMGIGNGIAKGLEAKGTFSDVIDVRTDQDKKVTIYDYLIIVAEPNSAFSSKISDALRKYLENAGVVSGKRAACILTGGLLKSKAMANLMRIAESQGIILKTSEFIKSEGEAKAFASKLNVQRNY